MSNVPQTIDDILRHYGKSVDSQGYEVPEFDDAKAQLKAIIEAEIAGIIGEEWSRPWNENMAWVAKNNPSTKARIELRKEQRQRAAEAMERMFGEGGSMNIIDKPAIMQP